jgi:hypothetical protein
MLHQVVVVNKVMRGKTQVVSPLAALRVRGRRRRQRRGTALRSWSDSGPVVHRSQDAPHFGDAIIEQASDSRRAAPRWSWTSPLHALARSVWR